MSRLIDITGVRFGRIQVVSMYTFKGGRTYWYWRCDCGRINLSEAYSLKSGGTKSCGCFRVEQTSKRKITHGLRKHPLYDIWSKIKERCNNSKNIAYKNYGGRGISVFKQWECSFDSFYKWCIENKWEKGLEIDRINNNGNYEPHNCRIVTRKINSRNRRTNKPIHYMGKLYWSWELEEIYGIPKIIIQRRLRDYKWPIEKALTMPVLKRNRKLVNYDTATVV